MNKPGLIMIFLMTPLSFASANEIDSLLAGYRNDGAAEFSAVRGKLIWTTPRNIDGEQRACSSCHTADPVASGKHVKTGKPIEPNAVVTACQQACPSDAITFGNVRDDSADAVQKVKQSEDRAYHALQILNTRSAVTYLAQVRREENEGAH